MGLVILKRFDNSIDAHILKIKLESEGITCFLFDEHIVTMNALYSNLVGGIKLKVNEEDFIFAKNVLFDLNETPYTDENNQAIVCPKCASTRLESGYRSYKNVGGVISAIFSFLLTIFPVYSKAVYRCTECGHEFDQK